MTKSFIMIQITVNSNHNIDYEKIEGLILGENIEKSNTNRKLIEFFKEIRKCGFGFYFLWITDTQKKKISKNVDKFLKTQFAKLIVVDQLEDVHKIISS